MTGNVAQVFTTDSAWATVLDSARAALSPAGYLVFEARDPAREAWLAWTPQSTATTAVVPGVGRVSAHCEVTDVALPLVSFRWTYRFTRDGSVLKSDSTLRFRSSEELMASLNARGFRVRELRGAPDRPGAELVFLAQPH